MGCGVYNKPQTIKSQSRSNSTKIKSTPDDFITQNAKSFIEVYKVGRSLGSGAYGEVKLVTHKVTGQERAAKIYKKNLDQRDVYEKTKNEKNHFAIIND